MQYAFQHWLQYNLQGVWAKGEFEIPNQKLAYMKPYYETLKK